MRYPILAFCLWSLLYQNLSADGLDEATAKELLSRPILNAEMSQQEIQAFVGKRIPSMPVVESRDAWQTQADRIRQQVLEPTRSLWDERTGAVLPLHETGFRRLACTQTCRC
ncbi:MAG: hypothetical protein ABGX22_27505 [Pirellulaceae bacterium]|nr:hypothetical protein [Planctomycetaceae bacterium]